MRAGFGQYTTGDKETRRELSQMWFLQVAVEEATQLVPELYEIYEEFERRGFQFGLGTRTMTRFIGCDPAQLAESDSPLFRVRRAVEGWAGAFNLTTNGTAPKWVLRCAFNSFGLWQKGGPIGILAPLGVSAILPSIDYSITIPEFTLKYWNPFAGPNRNQFAKNVDVYLESVKLIVQHRLDEIESEALAAGCKPTPANVRLERYTWAARYQVAGIEVSEFRQRFGLHADPRGIRLAIQDILMEVGLTRRRPKNLGRPRTRKSPTIK